MEWINFTLLFIKQKISLFWLVLLIIITAIIYKFTHIKPELLGLIVSPLFTLSVLAILEERKAKWNAKYDAFLSIYANRGNLINYEVVRKLNCIDITFIDDPAVRNCWKNLCNGFNNPNSTFLSNEAKKIELLNAMAISLGLNKDIEYSDIANTYYPNGLGEFDELFKNKNNAELEFYQTGKEYFSKCIDQNNTEESGS